MDLFETFRSKENLIQALKYLQGEILESSLPLDPLWSPGLNAMNEAGESFFEALSEYLNNNAYKPDKASFIYAQKDNFNLRPIYILSVVDRLLYQAIFNPNILGNVIDKKLLSNCYGNRLSSDEAFFIPYKEKWSGFCDDQINAYKKGYAWRIEFDIKTYYENIQIHTLIQVLKKNFNVTNQKLLCLLELQLKTWKEKIIIDIGIPQGPRASAVLANAYLHPLDIFISDNCDKDLKYSRYNDDMVLMAKDENTIRKNLEKIVHFLREYNLSLNEKTKLDHLKNATIIEERKLYGPYGKTNKPSREKIKEIRKELPLILSKLKNGEEVKKSEKSSLKYYLKASIKSEPDQLIENIIQIIPYVQDLIDMICKHTAPFILQAKKDINSSSKKGIQSLYEQFWQLYDDSPLNEYTEFWILKLLSAAPEAQKHKELQEKLKLILNNKDEGLFRTIPLFYEASNKKQNSIGFTLDDIRKLIRSSETDVERAIYYYFAIYLIGIEDIETLTELTYEALNECSLEVQIVGIYLTNKLGLKISREINGGLSKLYFKTNTSNVQIAVENELRVIEPTDKLLKLEVFLGREQLAKEFGFMKQEPKALESQDKAVNQKPVQDENNIPHIKYNIISGNGRTEYKNKTKTFKLKDNKVPFKSIFNELIPIVNKDSLKKARVLELLKISDSSKDHAIYDINELAKKLRDKTGLDSEKVSMSNGDLALFCKLEIVDQ